MKKPNNSHGEKLHPKSNQQKVMEMTQQSHNFSVQAYDDGDPYTYMMGQFPMINCTPQISYMTDFGCIVYFPLFAPLVPTPPIYGNSQYDNRIEETHIFTHVNSISFQETDRHSMYTHTISLPHSHRQYLGRLIGPKGNTIRIISEENFVNISGLPAKNDPVTDYYTLQIQGPSQAKVNRAASTINQLLLLSPNQPECNRVKTTPDVGHIQERTFSLDHSYRKHLGRLFGPGGSTIQRLTSGHNVQVHGLPSRETALRDCYTVTVRGSSASSIEDFIRDIFRILTRKVSLHDDNVQQGRSKGVITEPISEENTISCQISSLVHLLSKNAEVQVQLEATIIHVSEIGRVIICDGTHIVKCSLLKKEEIESVCIGQVVKVLAIAATSDFELGKSRFTGVSDPSESNITPIPEFKSILLRHGTLKGLLSEKHDVRPVMVWPFVVRLNPETFKPDVLLIRSIDSAAALKLFMSIRELNKRLQKRVATQTEIDFYCRACAKVLVSAAFLFETKELELLAEKGHLTLAPATPVLDELSSRVEMLLEEIKEFAKKELDRRSKLTFKIEDTDGHRWHTPHGFLGHIVSKENCLETPLQSARRLFLHELGISAAYAVQGEPIHSLSIVEEVTPQVHVNHICFFFATSTKRTLLTESLPREVAEVKWISLEEIEGDLAKYSKRKEMDTNPVATSFIHVFPTALKQPSSCMKHLQTLASEVATTFKSSYLSSSI